jgi:hypothetical protein
MSHLGSVVTGVNTAPVMGLYPELIFNVSVGQQLCPRTSVPMQQKSAISTAIMFAVFLNKFILVIKT